MRNLIINLTVTNTQWKWNKFITYEKLKIIVIWGIYKTVYRNDSISLLFEKNHEILYFHVNNTCDFEISSALF